MSDNWQPGDLALCVKDGNYNPRHVRKYGRLAVAGSTYLVIGTATNPRNGRLGLILSQWPNLRLYARNFVKATPREIERSREKETTL